jgi:hypothetical protein
LLVVCLLSACSTIIGVSDYEIDPALDTARKTEGGGDDGGGKGPVIESGAGGEDTGGTGVTGGTGGTGVTGGTGGTGVTGGTGGTGGEPILGCQGAGDCDDTIECTTDACNAAHECVHTPKNTVCDASLCETCQAGIGCVAGAKTKMQLLLDPDFDLLPSEWEESSQSDGISVVTAAGALSGAKVANFGPGNITAENQYYADIFQWVTIPERTVALALTGSYKLAPGAFKPEDDQVLVAFYEPDDTDSFAQLHFFEAAEGAQTAWKAFIYTAPKAKVAMMGGKEYTFDLVAYVWDSVFQFDSLQLNATVCQ